jgi:hypothetical protein
MSVLMAKMLRRYQEENDGNGNDLGEGQETVGTNNDARVAMLNRINDQNDELAANNGDLVSLNDDGTTAPFVVLKEDGSLEELKDEAKHDEIIDHDALSDQAAAAKKIAEDAAAAQAAQPRMVTIKVNGVEQQVTEEELIARAQKVAAADQYLAEAARLRNEIAGQAREKQDEPTQQQIEDDLALARAIQMGSEEEAVAAIRKIKSAPTLSPDVLAKTVDERLTFNDAIRNFRNDFSDLVADPYLNKMVMDKDAELIRNGDKRSYSERYTAIGNEVRAWVASKAPAAKTEEAVKTPVVDKQTRKENVQAVPKAAGGKTPSTIEEEKEESTSDVIAGIAKARGGPQWLRS